LDILRTPRLEDLEKREGGYCSFQDAKISHLARLGMGLSVKVMKLELEEYA
jgi:hypothetical protein|tara:strand:+ start:315 stop:467 length:153 start_codon:yes stop_codon:yes gene_type:complete